MNPLSVFLVAFFWATPLLAQSATQLRNRSTCEEALQKPPGSYGVRLDASQNAYLQARRLNGRYFLFTVRSESRDQSCGPIIDVAEAPRGGDYFVFDCENATSPADIVVGLWPHERKSYRGLAVAAWKVDLSTLRFTRVHAPVGCVIQGRSGSDEGGDLRGEAEKRVSAKRGVGHEPKDRRER